MPIGNIVTPATVDTYSANASTQFPLLAMGGTTKTFANILLNNTPAVLIDPLTSTYPNAPGVPIPPNPVPAPPNLTRTLVSLVNPPARGVYFGHEDGTYTNPPVSGDALTGSGAVPHPRPLTEPTIHPTIFIGTRT